MVVETLSIYEPHFMTLTLTAIISPQFSCVTFTFPHRVRSLKIKASFAATNAEEIQVKLEDEIETLRESLTGASAGNSELTDMWERDKLHLKESVEKLESSLASEKETSQKVKETWEKKGEAQQQATALLREQNEKLMRQLEQEAKKYEKAEAETVEQLNDLNIQLSTASESYEELSDASKAELAALAANLEASNAKVSVLEGQLATSNKMASSAGEIEEAMEGLREELRLAEGREQAGNQRLKEVEAEMLALECERERASEAHQLELHGLSSEVEELHAKLEGAKSSHDATT